MKNALLYENVLNAIREKIPQHTKMAGILADMLFIEKEAVYRRLRGEVPFTFFEIVTISQKLGISLDKITGCASERSKPFLLNLMDFSVPHAQEFERIESFANLLLASKDEPDSEFGFASSMLPGVLYLNYPHLTRFYYFKWQYLFGAGKEYKKYAESVVPEVLTQVYADFVKAAREINTSYHVFDHRLFEYLVNDIRYFDSIRMITSDELSQIKQDVLGVLDELEQIAISGEYGCTGKKVHIFISNLNFLTNYSYLETRNHRISMVKTFMLNELVSTDSEIFARVKDWLRSLQRLSTMISVSGERARIQFFDEQREIVEQL